MRTNKKWALAFKYCGKGCGTDFYYGYSVEQTVGTIEEDNQLSKLPLLLFDDDNELIKKSLSFDKTIVIYLFRSVSKKEVFKEATKLKGNSRFILVAAGTHPSGDPQKTLEYFDYVVVGDCEIVIRDLIKNILKGKMFPEIKGVWYKKNKRLVSGGRAEFVDLNKIPAFAPKHGLFSPIEITRGCPYYCHFCSIPYIYGGKLRHRDIGEIIKWVKIAKKHNRRVINFLTPNAFSYGSPDGKIIKKGKIRELLKRLAEIKGVTIIFGNYLSNIRPDFISEELMSLVKEYTKTKTVHIGGQSGSDGVLKRVNAGYTVNDVKKAVKIIKKLGFNCQVDIIFGLPEETEADRKKTLDFINFLIDQGVKPRIHAFMPLPGTPFSKKPAGKIPLEYKKHFRELAHNKKVMLPLEYEEAACA